MRILNIISQKPYATGSGIYLSEIMREFQDMGHTQALVCGIDIDEPNFGQYKKTTNAKIYPLVFNSTELPFSIFGMSDTMPYPSRMFKSMTLEEKNQYEMAFLNKIRQVIKEFSPDIIICHHLYLLTALVVENFPEENIVAISHGTCIRQLKNISFERDRIIDAIKKLKTVFALQSIQKEDIKKIFGIADERIHIIGNGYNPKIFNTRQNFAQDIAKIKNAIDGDYKSHRNSKNQNDNSNIDNDNFNIELIKTDIANNSPVLDIKYSKSNNKNIVENHIQKIDSENKNFVIKLAYAGKISTSKGIKALINAISKLEYPLELNLAGGSGNQQEFVDIRAMAEQSKHKIIFLGHKTQNELAEIYSKSHLFVFPSFYEGLGLSIIEAMACGLDVVVSNTEGLQEWIYSKMENPPIIFVDLPQMKNADEPLESELPNYENRLADAINKQIENLQNKAFKKNNIDMTAFSWKKIAESILSHK